MYLIVKCVDYSEEYGHYIVTISNDLHLTKMIVKDGKVRPQNGIKTANEYYLLAKETLEKQLRNQ